MLLAYSEETTLSAFIKRATWYVLLVFTALMISDDIFRISIFHHNFAVVSFIGGLLCLLWLFKLYIYKCSNLSPFLPVLLMFIWFFFTIIWSMDPPSTWSALTVFAAVFIYALIFYDMIETDAGLKLCWQIFILSLFACNIGILYLAMHHIYYGGYRATIMNYNPNDFAYLVIISLPFIGYLIESGKNKFLIYLNYIYLIIAPTTIILTASRAAILSLGIVAIYYFYKYRHFFKKVKNILLLLLILIIPIFFLIEYAPSLSFKLNHAMPPTPISPSSSLGIPLGKYDLSNGRIKIWVTGLKLSQSHLVEGTGFATFANLMSLKENLYIAAHNIFIQIFVETGIVGFLLFLVWYTQLALMVLRNSQAIMLSTMFIVFTIVASLNNIFLMKQTWFFVATILVMNKLDKKTVSMKTESNLVNISRVSRITKC